MQWKTKWGTFIGTEEDYKAFVLAKERKEKPEPAKKAAPKKKTVKKAEPKEEAVEAVEE